MPIFFNVYKKSLDYYRRFGPLKTLSLLMGQLLYHLIGFDCLHIIEVPRSRIRVPGDSKGKNLESRLANEEELLAMRRSGEWEIDEIKMQQFRAGDVCLIVYVNGELSGYTWAHFKGTPVLIPGLRIRIPHEYIYNYGAFTHPKFRGLSLQSYRHYKVLENPEWKDRIGLLGYVKYTNWGSIRGQTKSGYISIGRIWIIGKSGRLYALVSRKLKRLGIERIPLDS
jgi:hypothetical protein